MLRPSDVAGAIRAHLVLPRDRLESCGSAFFYIASPKTAARFARHQHARIDDPSIVSLLDSIFGKLKPTELLSLYTTGTFRSRWNALLGHFNLPYGRGGGGATPGVLRGSSVTDFYIHTEDVARAKWRGRWRGVNTLEYYLQEAAAQMFLSYLDTKDKDFLLIYVEASAAVVSSFLTVGSTAHWKVLVGVPAGVSATARLKSSMVVPRSEVKGFSSCRSAFSKAAVSVSSSSSGG